MLSGLPLNAPISQQELDLRKLEGLSREAKEIGIYISHFGELIFIDKLD